MWPIATDVAWSQCVRLSVGDNREPCRMAELVEVPFGYGLGWA